MEPFPDAWPLEAQRSFSRRPQTQDRVSTRLEQPQAAPDPASRPTFLKLFNFYTGVTLSLCGVGAFLAGAPSRKWVEVEVTVPQGVRLGYKLQTLAHMGPWLACNHNKHCDRPWILAPGLGKLQYGLVKSTTASWITRVFSSLYEISSLYTNST